jgi:hypothetical protein
LKRRNQINRQLRRETRERKSQQDFIKLPTAKRARRTAAAEANVQYKPVLRGLRSEIAGSRKREGELKSWYGGLTAQNAAAQQSAATSSQAQESALTQRLANASASDSANLQDLASKNEATAKLLGGPTNSRGLAEAAAGNTAVAQQRVALTSPLTAERASQQGYLAQRGISATERGIEARKAETSRRRKIKEDLRAGKKERGQAVVGNLEKLREGARDYAIQKQAFGQKGKELGQEAREGAADRRLKAREGAADRSIDQAKLGISQAKLGLEQRKTNQAGRKVRREARETGGKNGVSHKAYAAAKSHYETGTTRKILNKKTGEWETRDNLPYKSWGELANEVTKESEINSVEARRAVARIRKEAEAQERRIGAEKQAKAKAALGHSHR